MICCVRIGRFCHVITWTVCTDWYYCTISRHRLNRNMNPAGLDEELLLNVMRDKLTTHPCKNQGYVLEDFPQTREQAKELFDGESDTPRSCTSGPHLLTRSFLLQVKMRMEHPRILQPALSPVPAGSCDSFYLTFNNNSNRCAACNTNSCLVWPQSLCCAWRPQRPSCWIECSTCPRAVCRNTTARTSRGGWLLTTRNSRRMMWSSTTFMSMTSSLCSLVTREERLHHL